MSANNYISIKWKKTRYEVAHCDADSGRTLDKIGKEGTLEKAVRLANAFTRQVEKEGGEIEYGLRIRQRPTD